MRSPFQVLVVPYRVAGGSLEFLILKRSDMDIWQWVAGGGEEHETPLEAAHRELSEELGVTNLPQQLQAQATIPVTDVVGEFRWQAEHLVITEYAFCVDVAGQAPQLSYEHTAMRWVSYREAKDLLTWDSNRTAAWEVMARHKHNWWTGLGE